METCSTMRVDELKIRGYRRLHDTFMFASGLTLVSGPNEAGKSTLHDALIRSMFGFSPEERRRHDGSSTSADCRPWAGGQFGLTLRACDPDDRAVLAVWDFETGAVELQDANTGESLLREQPRQRADYQIGTRLVGIARDEFMQVCCLHQQALTTVRPSESLRGALQRAVEATPGEDGGISAADDSLKRLLAEIGVNAGHYGNLAGGELQRLLDRERALGEELDKAREQRRTLDALVSALGSARAERETLEVRRLAIQRARLHASIIRLDQRQQRAEELRAAGAQRASSFPALTRELIGREHELRAQLENIVGRERLVAEVVEQRASEVAECRRGQAELETRVRALRDNAQVDLDAEGQVRELLAGIRANEQERAPEEAAQPPQADPSLVEYRRRRGELLAAPRERLWNRPLLVTAVVLATTGAVGGALVSPALLVLVLAALIVAAAARVSGRASADAQSPFGGRSIEELDAACAAEDQTFAAYEATRRAEQQVRGGAEQRRRELEQRLAAAMEGQLAGRDSEELIERAERYLHECEGSRAHAEAVAQSGQAALRLQELEEPERRLRALTEERARPASELRELYRVAGIHTEDHAAAAVEFQNLAARAREEESVSHDAEGAAAALSELLQGATIEQLAGDLAGVRASLAEHERAHGEIAIDGLGDDEGELSDALTAAEAVLHNRDIDLAEQQTVIEQREQALLVPSDLEVELAGVQERRYRLELLRNAARVARDGLRDAAQQTHRRVAPHLNDALRRELPRITRGRYRDGAVDEDLAIKLYAPESGRLVSIEQLSRGTRDQVALIQRLEIARLLDPTAGRTPLLLDDPFSHFDPRRAELGVEMIFEVAERRQVVLFSESPEVASLIESAGGDFALIELADPVEDEVGV
jgi:DNA repair exonuclease SbcCD ATPase subunit